MVVLVVMLLVMLLLLGQDSRLLHVLQPQLGQVDLARVLPVVVVTRGHLGHHVGWVSGRRDLLDHQVT